MAQEIEHKFLICNDSWRSQVHKSIKYKQGYMVSDHKRSVRIRISDNMAWINFKSAVVGTSRNEFEYEIPLQDGIDMLKQLCQQPILEKTRYFVHHEQHLWEIDVFEGDNQGLIVAEIELNDINESFAIPDWAGQEVTHDLRYYNNSLCTTPFNKW